MLQALGVNEVYERMAAAPADLCAPRVVYDARGNRHGRHGMKQRHHRQHRSRATLHDDVDDDNEALLQASTTSMWSTAHNNNNSQYGPRDGHTGAHYSGTSDTDYEADAAMPRSARASAAHVGLLAKRSPAVLRQPSVGTLAPLTFATPHRPGTTANAVPPPATTTGAGAATGAHLPAPGRRPELERAMKSIDDRQSKQRASAARRRRQRRRRRQQRNSTSMLPSSSSSAPSNQQQGKHRHSGTSAATTADAQPVRPSVSDSAGSIDGPQVTPVAVSARSRRAEFVRMATEASIHETATRTVSVRQLPPRLQLDALQRQRTARNLWPEGSAADAAAPRMSDSDPNQSTEDAAPPAGRRGAGRHVGGGGYRSGPEGGDGQVVVVKLPANLASERVAAARLVTRVEAMLRNVYKAAAQDKTSWPANSGGSSSSNSDTRWRQRARGAGGQSKRKPRRPSYADEQHLVPTYPSCRYSQCTPSTL